MATSVDMTSRDYLFLLIIWILATLLVRTYTRSCTKARLPPGPLALPILGHSHLLNTWLPRALQALAARYGPLMQIFVGATPFFVVSDADTAKEILKTHDLDFASKFEAGPKQYNIYKGTFVNAPYGTYWRFIKKLCMTKLFVGPQLARFIGIREDETNKLMRSLVERSNEEETCDLSKELTAMANRMIFRMVLGRRCSENLEKATEMRNFITDIMLHANKFRFWEVFGPLKNLDLFGNGKRVRMAILGYDNVLEEIMKDYEDHRMDGCDDEEKDVMDILLETHRDPNAEVMLSRDQIKYFFMEIFMAGVDTTSTAIQWTMTELINHPEVLEKLREEIDSVVGFSRLIRESDVPNLPYLQAVVKESLRLHPPGPLLRRMSNIDCKINGYDVKVGTRFFINIYMIMRDPNRYEDPDRFLPKRFLLDSSLANGGIRLQGESKGQDFHFLPFGSGRRACIGASHASFVMHGTLGALIQCFDLKVQGAEKVDIKLGAGFAGVLPFPLVCYPVIRFNPFKE